jgi:hypothetical protein
MKKIFLAATAALALAGAATAASATTFAGSYSVDTYDGNNGLRVDTSDQTSLPGPNFSINLASIGSTQTFNLFEVFADDEGSVNNGDTTSRPITLTFDFTAPSSKTGEIDGDTFGQIVQVSSSKSYQQGVLDWDNNGDTTVNFGALGTLLIHVNDITFSKGSTDWNNEAELGDCPRTPTTGAGGCLVQATFTLQAPTSAVPEPMSWALMLTGFLGVGAAMRASRRRSVFTAA